MKSKGPKATPEEKVAGVSDAQAKLAAKAAREHGIVKVALDTVVLTEEQADALAFAAADMVSADRRVVARLARGEARAAAVWYVKSRLADAVAKLRTHRAASELAAARAEYDRLGAKVASLEARATADQPAGERVEETAGVGG